MKSKDKDNTRQTSKGVEGKRAFNSADGVGNPSPAETSEFNLSNFIYEGLHVSGDLPVFKVKEFIRRLKEELEDSYDKYEGTWIYTPWEIIDKLAGEKLIEEGEE